MTIREFDPLPGSRAVVARTPELLPKLDLTPFYAWLGIVSLMLALSVVGLSVT